ncbi:hypothetical protein COU20_03360 [Candidatus Kaiserbacteria bacterium CG10_big_fil_rev_8_21_14_0_10_59_10]|uniref:Uncharacterized protein n=1 Tax=Candidatus Kaiserbacteria bacterium CG10_big_fil_rev_8_21_14_0_10_59_10 TaxID=1974612 RepID=A0A2H0U6Z9_9BACT|nr:MAG: hypothetical protein COU20_03360 [Candidatus Kaiserbacteria bacterium CG10_big_fil_rev_8_21_14_0_10_59_10]
MRNEEAIARRNTTAFRPTGTITPIEQAQDELRRQVKKLGNGKYANTTRNLLAQLVHSGDRADTEAMVLRRLRSLERGRGPKQLPRLLKAEQRLDIKLMLVFTVGGKVSRETRVRLATLLIRKGNAADAAFLCKTFPGLAIALE